MKNPVITLDGLVTSPLIALNILLSRYFKTLKSQSVLHRSDTRSLQYDVNTGGSLNGIENNIQNNIEGLCKPYFDTFRCTVDANQTDNGRTTITLSFDITDNGRPISVANVLDFKGNSLERVRAISELGDI